MTAVLLATPWAARAASGDRHLDAPYFVLEHTDFVNAGVGGISAAAANGGGNGEIVLQGVSGNVTRALLYWHGIDMLFAAYGFSGGDNDYNQDTITRKNAQECGQAFHRE